MQIQKTLVFIDDDPDTLLILQNFFSKLGYKILTYSEASHVIEDLTSSRLQCDAIICDLALPHITGLEFTQRMRIVGNTCPIIIITANSKVEVAIEAVSEGAFDFLVKPLSLHQLKISIERALHVDRTPIKNEPMHRASSPPPESYVSIDGVIGKSIGFQQALELARRVSTSNANVLVTGESGTGKEVIAKTIHNLRPRRKLPFIAINCASIPENLLESELFGHAKGSFTGALEKKIGLFEEAEGGTIFLDEIGDLNLPLQAKLLRVLQERKIRRIGENIYRPFLARIISATHKNLRKEVEAKTFREDLFFRLNVIPIWVPPLRERKPDILPLAEYFLRKFSVANGVSKKEFSPECKQEMTNHTWQGNVRELENSIERALILSDSPQIATSEVITVDRSDNRTETPQEGFQFQKSVGQRLLSVDELTNKYVSYVLNLNQGVKEKTAKDLCIDRKTLYRRLREIDETSIQT